MKTVRGQSVGIVVLGFALGLALVCARSAAEGPIPTGPETEQRFPPLHVPEGFKATLFACDPLLEYPSVIAVGPRAGTVFVAHDYMTGLGTEIVRRDEIRLVEDTDGDGYADRSTLYAAGFNSIQGMAYHDGTVFVMHSPLLTALRDTDGDGSAEERRDLLKGLGLPPEENPPRLHCANGVAVGHDGWLYLALGDHGCDVARPEGDRFVFEGGGILRCRRDGLDLHVFATGLRNIYDVALDADLNVFVRDNENDGGDYKIRVCHSFFGADHGYPYLYYERPEEAMPPLADLGLGSSAGGVCYRESAFPTAYHGSLFFCEWGRSMVLYHREQAGSGFAPMKEVEFAFGAENDPYGLKPTDVIVDRDGSLLFSDWADGQRPRRGRGRIYRIRYDGGAQARSGPAKSSTSRRSPLEHSIVQLDSESYYARIEAQTALEKLGPEGLAAVEEALHRNQFGVRGRLHALWVLARLAGHGALDRLLVLAESDPEPRVRAQAVRAVADLADPNLEPGRSTAGSGSAVAERLATLGSGADPRVLREVVIALGRLRWAQTPKWLKKNLRNLDPALSHAAIQTLRRCGNWPAVLELLDQPDSAVTRSLALRALGAQADAEIVDGLIDRLGDEPDAGRQREYAEALTRVYKVPAPWVYWGYRPAPRPANTVAWGRTEQIEQMLDRMLADSDPAVRAAILVRMQREQVPPRLATLADWLHEEYESERVSLILASLDRQSRSDAAELLEGVVSDDGHTNENRLAAFEQLAGDLTSQGDRRLLQLASAIEDGPVLARLLRQLGGRSDLPSAPLLLGKLESPVAQVRAVAIDSLAALDANTASKRISQRLEDESPEVRLAAVKAVGKLRLSQASRLLLVMAASDLPAVRAVCLDALRRFGEAGAVPSAVASLDSREARFEALNYLAQFGDSTHMARLVKIAETDRALDTLNAIVRALARWQQTAVEGRRATDEVLLENAVARVQGGSGLLLHWRTTGPLAADAAAAVIEHVVRSRAVATENNALLGEWRSQLASGAESRVRVEPPARPETNSVWLAVSDVVVSEPGEVEFLASSNGTLRVWLDGRVGIERLEPRAFRPDSDRFEASLESGAHRLVVEVTSLEPAEFHVRFRRKHSTVETEQLIQHALTQNGNSERGRAVFFDVEKSQCIKCHRLGTEGGQIGPELTGVGGRFSRIHLIESLLEPSRTIAPSFEAVAVALADGRVFSGVRVEETDRTVTLGDEKGQRHVIEKSEIDVVQPQTVSIMPDNLATRLSRQEFVDLIAFLVAQKQVDTQRER